MAVFAVGIPLCVVGGLLYAWTSGKGIIDGCINAYGALYKIPGALIVVIRVHASDLLVILKTFVVRHLVVFSQDSALS